MLRNVPIITRALSAYVDSVRAVLARQLSRGEGRPKEKHAEAERQKRVVCVLHLPVDGFGGMGDAWVCAKCGLDKYPEVFPFNRRSVIREGHPGYDAWFALAQRAREEKRVAAEAAEAALKKV